MAPKTMKKSMKSKKSDAVGLLVVAARKAEQQAKVEAKEEMASEKAKEEAKAETAKEKAKEELASKKAKAQVTAFWETMWSRRDQGGRRTLQRVADRGCAHWSAWIERRARAAEVSDPWAFQVWPGSAEPR